MPGTSAVDEGGNDLNMALTSGIDVSARKNFKNAAKTVMNSVKAAGAISESTIGVDGKLTANNNGNRVVLLPDDTKNSKESIDRLNTNQPNDLNRFDDVICATDADGNVDEAVNPVNVAFEEIDMDKIETATADVILNEYPVDCFPDKWYERCPWCLEETPFMLKWRELRYHSYNLVENKYFETLCITLILISSMTLVSAS